MRSLIERISEILKDKGAFSHGHYHSPTFDHHVIRGEVPIDYDQDIKGIDLRTDAQLELLQYLVKYYDEDVFPIDKDEKSSYYFNNQYFSYSDALFLNAVIRHFRPRKIVEVGCGYSSAVMIETNKRYENNSIDLTMIEPFPARFNHLVRDGHSSLLKKQLQNVPVETFHALQKNDLLFIDSSHVIKFKSDLSYLFFEIMPMLNEGVIIHFHDIFFPFEYPIEWLKVGRYWNEAYLLRAFLQFNSKFEILLYTSYLEGKFSDWFKNNMPFCLKNHEYIQVEGKIKLMNTTGQSLYIVKT
jgi:predicted O-methyltransferase YrrM